MKRTNARYRRAFNWLRRIAPAYPGIVCTAVIDDKRVSCLVDHTGRSQWRTWHYFEEAK
jgi:hypothetical protein